MKTKPLLLKTPSSCSLLLRAANLLQKTPSRICQLQARHNVHALQLLQVRGHEHAHNRESSMVVTCSACAHSASTPQSYNLAQPKQSQRTWNSSLHAYGILMDAMCSLLPSTGDTAHPLLASQYPSRPDLVSTCTWCSVVGWMKVVNLRVTSFVILHPCSPTLFRTPSNPQPHTPKAPSPKRPHLELIGRDHQPLQQQHGGPVGDEAVALHLTQPQAPVAAAALRGLAREHHAGALGARMHLVSCCVVLWCVVLCCVVLCCVVLCLLGCGYDWAVEKSCAARAHCVLRA